MLEKSSNLNTLGYEYGSESRASTVVTNRSCRPNVLSFFSGAMGLDLGLEKTGLEVKLCCEIDKYSRQTIRKNRPEIPLIGDIENYTVAQIREAAGLTIDDRIDLIVGGPPCQAFSTAGKRQGFNDQRGNVFLKFLDLALELRPRFLVIENVRGLLSCPMEHRPLEMRGADNPPLSDDELRGGALNFVLNRLRKAGFGYSFNLYNSANFGTPQIRERVVIVCTLDGSVPPYLMPTHSENGRNRLPEWRTFRSAVSGITEHTHLEFPEKRLRYYRMLKAGQNWRDLPDPTQKEALGQTYYSGGGRTGFFRRLAWDKPAPTLVTHPAMPATDLAHPEENRPLSVQEYKRIQEFPDSWEICGPLIEQYKQIGNAVPISLGIAVGRLVLSLIDGGSQDSMPCFDYSRYKNTNNIKWELEFERIRTDSEVKRQFTLNL